VAAGAAGTIWLAGRRDLGASTWADNDAKRPHTGLLGSQRLLAIRLCRTSAISWVAIAGLGSLLYGTFATSAGDAFASSDFASKLTAGITHQGQQATGVRLYAGIIFLFMMLALMGYVASAAGAIREQEAEGYLDNLLVRQVGRAVWLATRTTIVLAVTLLAGLTAGVGFWLGSRGGAGISLGQLAAAGLNAASATSTASASRRSRKAYGCVSDRSRRQCGRLHLPRADSDGGSHAESVARLPGYPLRHRVGRVRRSERPQCGEPAE
jgi:ABC-2 type transport system permease protein